MKHAEDMGLSTEQMSALGEFWSAYEDLLYANYAGCIDWVFGKEVKRMSAGASECVRLGLCGPEGHQPIPRRRCDHDLGPI